MKEKKNDILDGITPEQADAFRGDLREEPVPKDIDAARIAALVAQKTGLDCAGNTAVPAKKGKILKPLRWKFLIPVAAVICLCALMLSLLPAMVGRKPEPENANGTVGYGDGVITASAAEKTNLPYTEDADLECAAESPSEVPGGSADRAEEGVLEPEAYYGEILDEFGKSVIHFSKSEDVSDPDMAAVRASLLTAKEYRDLDDMDFWKNKLNDNLWYPVVSARDIRPENMVEVLVYHDGKPVYNAPVELLGGQDVLFSAVTDVQGRAYLFWGISPSVKKEMPQSVRAGNRSFEIPAEGVLKIEADEAGIAVNALDLMLMVDTTGSMGDEIAYLRTELEDTVKRVASGNGALSIRVSVNFYRDTGDDYVIKYYDFRTDIKECVEQIAAEHAQGGGDTPEAVHTALENAVTGHAWRENAVKLCFFVLDAGPHSEQEVRGVNDSLRTSLREAARVGIRIIPVVASGADTDCEYVMRSMAVLTNGTYVYLTDESGIGGAHKEAEINPEKENPTEYLNDCMVRLICEFCGMPYVPGQ